MVAISWLARGRALAAVGLTALALGACTDFVGKIPKHLAPLDASTKALVEKKGMDQKAPILIRLFKEESRLEIWKQQKATGRYALLKDYEICKWSGVLGPKLKEGDRQAPEGFYTIRPAQMNPNSSYHLSFNMGYPNEYDRAHGRTGTHLMVHGACSSAGCYSMTDEQIQEIYTIGRLAFEGGQRDFQVQAFPFRMTPENMARHRHNPNMPFWRMLKEGYDHFALIKQPPKVDVCDRRYVFNAVAKDNAAFNPTAACPPLMMPDEIRVALGKSDAEDDPKMLEMAAKLDRKEGTRAAAVLAGALAAPTTAAMAAPMSVAAAPLSVEPTATASIAATANVPAPAVAEAPTEAASPPSIPAHSIANVAPTPTEASPALQAGSVELAPTLAGVDPVQPDAPAVPAQGSISGVQVVTPAVAPAPTTAPPELLAPAPTFAMPAQPPPSPPADLAQKPTSAPDAATLEQRMQAAAPAPASPGLANAYAPQPEEEGGLTGFVMKLFE